MNMVDGDNYFHYFRYLESRGPSSNLQELVTDTDRSDCVFISLNNEVRDASLELREKGFCFILYHSYVI